jgi:hypothetical protein
VDLDKHQDGERQRGEAEKGTTASKRKPAGTEGDQGSDEDLFAGSSTRLPRHPREVHQIATIREPMAYLNKYTGFNWATGPTERVTTLTKGQSDWMQAEEVLEDAKESNLKLTSVCNRTRKDLQEKMTRQRTRE